MKKQAQFYSHLFAFHCFLNLLSLQAQALTGDLPKIDSDIKAATVYRNNAKIVRQAAVDLAEGTTEIVLHNLAPDADANSLQIQINHPVTLLSATYRKNYLESQVDKTQVSHLKDSIERIDYEMRWIASQQEVFREEEKLIKENRKVYSEEQGVKADELRKLSDLYRTKGLTIKKQLLDLDKRQIILQNKHHQWQSQRQQWNGNQNKPTGEIVLQLSTKKTTTANIEFSYIVSQAGWTPLYDLRADGLDQPLRLTYKANVYQNTGFDWEEVALTISTGNPNRNNSRPILYPQYVDFYVPLPTSNVSSLMNNRERAKSNMMATRELPTLPPIVMPEPMQMMEEVMSPMEPIVEKDKMDIPVSVEANQLNVSFVIETPYRIPADGKNHLVVVKTDEVATTYVYHSVPKLQQHAFLLAQITDWGELNLLKGKANLFFEGAYIGQSNINPQTTADTLLLSLGRDDNLAIKRTPIKDLITKKIIGKNKTETRAYEIMVRNNKTREVNIEILDQIPISKNGHINVKLIEAKGAKYTEDYGKIFWSFPLKAGATKQLKLLYQIKYPKNKTIGF